MVRLDGVTAAHVLEAVLSVLPVEKDEPESAWPMIYQEDASRILRIFAEFNDVDDQHTPDTAIHAIQRAESKAMTLDATSSS